MKPSRLLAGALIVLGIAVYVPETLAFPFHQRVAGVDVYSEGPISPALGSILKRADGLVESSPLAGPIAHRRLFLTSGGWRWRLLTLTGSGAFAQTRPLSSAVVINRSDPASDRVFNGHAVGGRRSLSGVIAHETAHIMTRQRYGPIRVALAPAWAVEGLADYVAREGSLSDSDVATLRAQGVLHPAIVYYDGRRRVARFLADGNKVDALF